MPSTPRAWVRPDSTLDETLTDENELMDEATPAVRVATLRGRALSLGISQAEDSPAVGRARAEGIPVLRRRTGGLGILTEDGDVAFSLVLPRDHPAVGRDFHRAFARLGEGVVGFLRSRAIETRWRAAPGLRTELCLLGLRGEALFLGDRVVGGSAQRATARALLHHGVLLYRFDVGRLSRIFDLPSETIAARLTALEAHGFSPWARTDLEALAHQFADRLSVPA